MHYSHELVDHVINHLGERTAGLLQALMDPDIGVILCATDDDDTYCPLACFFTCLNIINR